MGLFDIFSSKPGREAAAAREAGYQRGYNKAVGAIDEGTNTASGYYDEAYAPFEDLYAKGSRGYDAYLDAVGANGAEGSARALETFKATPGYQAGLDAAVEQSDRRMAQRGMLASGNTIHAGNEAAIDYVNKGYGDFVNRLAPTIGAATSAATGGGAIKTGQGNLYQTAGAQKAGYGWQAETGAGGAQADAAMAPYGASANMWNALMGAANLGANLYGYSTGAKKA